MNIETQFNIKDNLLKYEQQRVLICSNCNNRNIYYFIDNTFDYNEWKFYITLKTKNSKDYIKLRINDAIKISKNTNIHPTKVFNQLNSSYWAAFDWDICEQIAINRLKRKCINCEMELNLKGKK